MTITASAISATPPNSTNCSLPSPLTLESQQSSQTRTPPTPKTSKTEKNSSTSRTTPLLTPSSHFKSTYDKDYAFVIKRLLYNKKHLKLYTFNIPDTAVFDGYHPKYGIYMDNGSNSDQELRLWKGKGLEDIRKFFGRKRNVKKINDFIRKMVQKSSPQRSKDNNTASPTIIANNGAISPPSKLKMFNIHTNSNNMTENNNNNGSSS